MSVLLSSGNILKGGDGMIDGRLPLTCVHSNFRFITTSVPRRLKSRCIIYG